MGYKSNAMHEGAGRCACGRRGGYGCRGMGASWVSGTSGVVDVVVDVVGSC